MVSFADVTYRIVHVDTARYEVIRLTDEATVGSFVVGPKIVLAPTGIDASLLRHVAREAMKRGKTSWVFHETPKPPEAASDSSSGGDDSGPLTPRRSVPA